jgi:hypothetical protein
VFVLRREEMMHKSLADQVALLDRVGSDPGERLYLELSGLLRVSARQHVRQLGWCRQGYWVTGEPCYGQLIVGTSYCRHHQDQARLEATA